MTEPVRTRVLIADDHPLFRAGLTAAVRQIPGAEVVAEAGDGAEAILRYRQTRPDLGLFDLRMPGTDGVAAIDTIRAEFPAARLVVLTTFDGDEDIFRALRAGAAGYLLKDATLGQLEECVRAVLAGKRFVPPTVAAKLVDRMDGVELTPREREVLQHVGRGLGNKQVAKALGLSEGTVKGHVNSILAKLGAGSRTEAQAIALRRGLIRLD